MTDLTPERVRDEALARLRDKSVPDVPERFTETVVRKDDIRAALAELDRLRAELRAACSHLRNACDESAGRFVGPAEAFLARQEKPA